MVATRGRTPSGSSRNPRAGTSAAGILLAAVSGWGSLRHVPRSRLAHEQCVTIGMRRTFSTHNFAVRVSVGTETVIAVSGELDIATVSILVDALGQIDFASLRSVVLDLDELSFLDARGLREILALHRTCMRHWATLAIRPGPRAVHRVFEVTHTDRFLPLAPSPTTRTRAARGAA
jgi:anti-anti-sigma factor